MPADQNDYHIRPLLPADQSWVADLVREQWGSPLIVVRGQIFYPDQLPGYAATDGSGVVGLVTYRIDGTLAEIITLNSLREGIGIGTALIEAVKRAATSAGCQRLILITTNDNLPALHFYQKRGFRLAALYPNAIKQSRRIKPQISLTGIDGIPIRDEIELELSL